MRILYNFLFCASVIENWKKSKNEIHWYENEIFSSDKDLLYKEITHMSCRRWAEFSLSLFMKFLKNKKKLGSVNWSTSLKSEIQNVPWVRRSHHCSPHDRLSGWPDLENTQQQLVVDWTSAETGWLLSSTESQCYRKRRTCCYTCWWRFPRQGDYPSHWKMSKTALQFKTCTQVCDETCFDTQYRLYLSQILNTGKCLHLRKKCQCPWKSGVTSRTQD